MIAERTTIVDTSKKYRNRNTTSVKSTPKLVVYKSSPIQPSRRITIRAKLPQRSEVFFIRHRNVENNKSALKLYFNEALKSNINGKLEELKSLQNNWDGENSPAPNDELIDFAKSVSSKLIDNGKIISFCYPLKNGGLQLESSDEGANFEIELNPDQSIFELIYDDVFNLISNNQIELD